MYPEPRYWTLVTLSILLHPSTDLARKLPVWFCCYGYSRLRLIVIIVFFPIPLYGFPLAALLQVHESPALQQSGADPVRPSLPVPQNLVSRSRICHWSSGSRPTVAVLNDRQLVDVKPGRGVRVGLLLLVLVVCGGGDGRALAVGSNPV